MTSRDFARVLIGAVFALAGGCIGALTADAVRRLGHRWLGGNFSIFKKGD